MRDCIALIGVSSGLSKHDYNTKCIKINQQLNVNLKHKITYNHVEIIPNTYFMVQPNEPCVNSQTI